MKIREQGEQRKKKKTRGEGTLIYADIEHYLRTDTYMHTYTLYIIQVI